MAPDNLQQPTRRAGIGEPEPEAFAFTFNTKVISGSYYGPGYLVELKKVATQALAAGGWILEWGSGVSTLMLADLIRARNDCRLITIDDNEPYLRAVLAAMPDKRNVTAATCDLSGPCRDQLDQGLGYTTTPFALAPPTAAWKLIAIDGRRRMECALMATMLAENDTVIVLHDYRRLRYQPILGLCDIIANQPQYRVLRVNPTVLSAFALARARMTASCWEDAKLRAQALADVKILCS